MFQSVCVVTLCRPQKDEDDPKNEDGPKNEDDPIAVSIGEVTH